MTNVESVYCAVRSEPYVKQTTFFFKEMMAISWTASWVT